jgi:hypothetical protein
MVRLVLHDHIIHDDQHETYGFNCLEIPTLVLNRFYIYTGLGCDVMWTGPCLGQWIDTILLKYGLFCCRRFCAHAHVVDTHTHTAQHSTAPDSGSELMNRSPSPPPPPSRLPPFRRRCHALAAFSPTPLRFDGSTYVRTHAHAFRT